MRRAAGGSVVAVTSVLLVFLAVAGARAADAVTVCVPSHAVFETRDVHAEPPLVEMSMLTFPTVPWELHVTVLWLP